MRRIIDDDENCEVEQKQHVKINNEIFKNCERLSETRKKMLNGNTRKW